MFQLSSALSGMIFIRDELEKAHAYIKQHDLPVAMEENDLHKQIIQLEGYARSNHFEQALKQYKRINYILIASSVVILAIVCGIALVEYLSPELGLLQQLVSVMINRFALSMSVLGGLFAAILILILVRAVYGKRLHGKVLEKAWASIRSYVER